MNAFAAGYSFALAMVSFNAERPGSGFVLLSLFALNMFELWRRD